MNNLTILGSTGSIGASTLDVVRQHRDKYKVFALTANTQVAKIAQQCEIFHPQFAVMADETERKTRSHRAF